MRLTDFCELSIAQIEVYVEGRGGIDLLNSTLQVNELSSLIKDQSPEIMKFLGLSGGRTRLTSSGIRLISGRIYKKSNKYSLSHIRLYRHLGSKYYHLEFFFSTPVPLIYISISLFFDKDGKIGEVTSSGESKLLSSINFDPNPKRDILDKGWTIAEFIKSPGIYDA